MMIQRAVWWPLAVILTAVDAAGRCRRRVSAETKRSALGLVVLTAAIAMIVATGAERDWLDQTLAAQPAVLLELLGAAEQDLAGMTLDEEAARRFFADDAAWLSGLRAAWNGQSAGETLPAAYADQAEVVGRLNRIRDRLGLDPL